MRAALSATEAEALTHLLYRDDAVAIRIQCSKEELSHRLAMGLSSMIDAAGPAQTACSAADITLGCLCTDTRDGVNIAEKTLRQSGVLRIVEESAHTRRLRCSTCHADFVPLDVRTELRCRAGSKLPLHGGLLHLFFLEQLFHSLQAAAVHDRSLFKLSSEPSLLFDLALQQSELTSPLLSHFSI